MPRDSERRVPLFYSDINATTACSLCLASIPRACGNTDCSLDEYIDPIPPSDLFQGVSCFSSVPTCEQMVK